MGTEVLQLGCRHEFDRERGRIIKANMPLSQGNSLSDEDSWAVAAFIDSQERPQDPRFMGSVEETRAAHHNSPLDMYGTAVDGAVLGANSFASGTVPK